MHTNSAVGLERIIMSDILLEIQPGLHFYMRNDGNIGLACSEKSHVHHYSFTEKHLSEVIRQSRIRTDNVCGHTRPDSVFNGAFRHELTELINKHGFEKITNTPDSALALYLVKCLAAFNTAFLRASSFSS